MHKPHVSPKHSYQLHFQETRRCKQCGTEFEVEEILNFDAKGYDGHFHECPHCDSPFDYEVIASNFDERVRKAYDEMADLDEHKMLSECISVKQARRILKLFLSGRNP